MVLRALDLAKILSSSYDCEIEYLDKEDKILAKSKALSTMAS